MAREKNFAADNFPVVAMALHLGAIIA